MKTLVLLFIGMTLAFLAESCQGDRTQRQQSVLKIEKSKVKVHLEKQDIYVATETGGQMQAVVV
jgi:fructose-1,6-bisphosphatase